MERKLEGKVALITGSGRGIGRELALMLAKDGAHIVVNDLDSDPANQTVSDIMDMGGKAVACNGIKYEISCMLYNLVVIYLKNGAYLLNM